jgi:transcriptional regulator with XRE-family HTH domain
MNPKYWNTLSNMTEAKDGVDARIAARVRELRDARGLSLDALAAKSGVSRSMISVVERGESSPTAVLLDKLAVGLGVTLVELFAAPIATNPSSSPVSRREEQMEWKDPGSGYLRRNLSPPGKPQPMQIVEVQFPAGARVAFETSGRSKRVYQQIWLLDGEMNVTVGEDRHQLRKGDCLAMELDQPVIYHNPARKPARYAVVICEERSARRQT